MSRARKQLKTSHARKELKRLREYLLRYRKKQVELLEKVSETRYHKDRVQQVRDEVTATRELVKAVDLVLYAINGDLGEGLPVLPEIPRFIVKEFKI